ncbi:hypothetical protein MGYG_01545 [Nannizzia gypsea CBS 118893]|uniref:Rhodopsin domain-containing protein n=1 Tax=Arthroderma gypseum (strain ATCC MYA-4604 / CBS 118893) TaxID=535722 RepID=E5R1I2_ARTGP|nr:hypothetical protein MGYG_01545 [Nannizzia gypsea CBS 118893]EFQ98518.1 hypothetical protein MGYG_01545 [Nannizzia gypsea CBS 118893]
MESPSTVPDGHRAYNVTDTDQSGHIVIVSTLLMSWMVLCFFIRIYIRSDINGPFGLDDLVAGIGSALGIVHVGVLLKAVSQGIGKSKEYLRPTDVNSAEQTYYSSDILFILAHSCAKASVSLLLFRLGRDPLYKRGCAAIALFIGIWGIAATATMSIKCDFSKPWILSDKCSQIELRWQLITAFDVLPELLMFGMLVYLIWGLQMVMSRKVVIVGAFACRLPVVGFSIFRLTTINGAVDLQDPTLSMVPYVIWTEILLHYSIMAATIPCLKPFFIAFNTGWGQGSHKRTSRYPQYTSGASSKTGTTFSNKFGKIIGSSQADFRNDASGTRCLSHALNREEAPSIESHESQRMIIRETRGWTVEHESWEMSNYGNTRQA